MVRAGYRYEKDITSAEDRTTYYTGVSVGASFVKRLSPTGPTLGFDYAYRPTQRPDNGVHNFSLRFIMNKKGKTADESF